MKSIFTTFILITFWSLSLFGQIYNPVSWEHQTIKTGEDTYDIIYLAEIETKWSIYSQYLKGEDGPIPTSFNYDEASHFELVDKNVECDLNRKEAFDKLFDMTLVKYGKQAIFRQSIKCTDASKPITGYLEFMTCDEEKCLPPAMIDFELDLSNSHDAKAVDYNPTNLCKGKVSFAAATPQSEEPVEKSVKKAKKKNKDKKNQDQKVSSSPPTSNSTIKESAQSSQESGISISGIGLGDDKGGMIDPVHWSMSITRMESGNAVLEAKAVIDEGWHIYSNKLERDDGPNPTNMTLDESDAYTLVGELQEKAKKVVSGYDDYFEMDLTKLKESATLTQTLAINDDTKPIKGFVEYIACTVGKCLTPVYIDFEANAKSSTILVGDELSNNGTGQIDEGQGLDKSELEKLYGVDPDDYKEPIATCTEEIAEEDNSLWTIFYLGFIGGLLALLTPCVFPMIPLTVSFFTKSAEKKGKRIIQCYFLRIVDPFSLCFNFCSFSPIGFG